MLKRSYRGFVLWMAGYFALMISASFLPIKDNELQARTASRVLSIMWPPLALFVQNINCIRVLFLVILYKAYYAFRENRSKFMHILKNENIEVLCPA